MRALRTIASVMLVSAALVGLTGLSIQAADEGDDAFHQVTGILTVQTLAPGGSWEVSDGVSEYREYPISASGLTFSDARLNGTLESVWNWDVLGAGHEPVPSWGTMQVGSDGAAWTGDFSGIRRVDGGPIDLRAALSGEGDNAGSCTTLDILATGTEAGDVWIVDGVVYPC